jgi:hypothetical protein
VRARPGGTLVNIGEAARDEAVIPLGKPDGMGVTIINEFHITAVDPDGTGKVVNDYIIPAITRSLENNTDGSRVTMQKAPKLKQPGAF